tara:strand:- start:3191 stop:4003 length:813 start_codon:yes stop_codon:yes gene_type:complete
MNKLNMFCISLQANHLQKIKTFNYLPVGLGNSNFSNDWFRDDKGENISNKNKYYGEYTFHYWLWKNYLDKIDDGWIGFCQYRKFWSTENINLIRSNDHLKEIILKEIPKSYENTEVILGEESAVNKFKLMKFLKRGMGLFLKNPSYFFNKNKRNIKFHFDMWHGEFYLNKAIELLDKENRKDFENFVNTKTSFHPHNMFICKSKKIMKNYYETVFPWLKRCEDEFGFENLKGYGQIRIYGFLAERFMSYWFQKNTKYQTMPILHYDIGKE